MKRLNFLEAIPDEVGLHGMTQDLMNAIRTLNCVAEWLDGIIIDDVFDERGLCVLGSEEKRAINLSYFKIKEVVCSFGDLLSVVENNNICNCSGKVI